MALWEIEFDTPALDFSFHSSTVLQPVMSPPTLVFQPPLTPSILFEMLCNVVQLQAVLMNHSYMQLRKVKL